MRYVTRDLFAVASLLVHLWEIKRSVFNFWSTNYNDNP